MRPRCQSSQQASSRISLSNRRSTWSIRNANNQLTCSTLLDFLCRDRKNGKHFNHDLDYHVCHPRGWWHFDIGLQSPEEALNALKDRGEHDLTIGNGFGSLGELGVTVSSIIEIERKKNTLREGRRFQ